MRFLRTSMAVLFLIGSPLHAAENAVLPQPPSQDPIERGLWWLYHFKYKEARAVFQEMTTKNPNDPASHFYKAAVNWWHLLQRYDFDLPDVEREFEEDYQETVRTAKAVYENADNPKQKALAAFYLGGAEGLKGRWLVAKRQFVKAYFLGKRGNALLKEALQLDPTLYDAYMGLGIYDYFTDTLSGVEALLSAILIRGDRNRGIQQLYLAMEKGHYAKTEAAFFLIEIFTFEEEKPEKAVPLVQKLKQELPYSPVLHLADMMIDYKREDWVHLEPKARDFLEKCEKETPYYTREGARAGIYLIGLSVMMGKRDLPAAQPYLQKILDMGIDSSRWTTFAYLRMAQMNDLLGKREEALKMYRIVLARKNFGGSQTEARAGLRKPFTFPPLPTSKETTSSESSMSAPLSSASSSSLSSSTAPK